MKSIVVALALAVALAAPAASSHANLLSPADEKLYREAFAQAEREDFSAARNKAAAAQDQSLAKVLHWMELTGPGADVTFAEITAFIRGNPDWPRMSTLRRRAEEAITVATPADALLAWFPTHSPTTADGKTAYGGALLTQGDRERGVAVLRDAWVNENFGVLQERQFLARYGEHLRQDDHVARLDRLLWERRDEAAQRMILKVPMDHRLLAQARLALFKDEPGVEAAIDKVPRALADNPGLIFERVRWRRQRDLDDSAIALLASPAADKVRPEMWWTERAILARRALQRGHITQAYDLARQHGLEEDGRALADAEWLAGWIALRYLNDEAAALRHFKTMFDGVATPISRARGAYWAGRAAEAMKDAKRAKGWYENAAGHVTTYYGQLAAARLSKDHEWPLPSDPLASAKDIEAFEKHELTRVVRMLGEIGVAEAIGPFVMRLNDIAETPGQRALAANLATSQGRPDLAVSIARRADREGVTLIASGYPVPSIEIQSPEKALVFALIRQESGFHQRAISSAGARGLMQLMPATAKQVAQGLNVGYSPEQLHDPAYNVRLGSAYLGKVLGSFNGSYVLSLAAYNAGPSRVREWIREYGDPRNPEVDPIDWIENIPFSETRNYVQRVLESVQVYRRRLGATDFARSLDRDLRR